MSRGYYRGAEAGRDRGGPSAVADGHFQIAAGLAQGAALVREMRVAISEEGNSSMARGGMADVTK